MKIKSLILTMFILFIMTGCVVNVVDQTPIVVTSDKTMTPYIIYVTATPENTKTSSVIPTLTLTTVPSSTVTLVPTVTLAPVIYPTFTLQPVPTKKIEPTKVPTQKPVKVEAICIMKESSAKEIITPDNYIDHDGRLFPLESSKRDGCLILYETGMLKPYPFAVFVEDSYDHCCVDGE